MTKHIITTPLLENIQEVNAMYLYTILERMKRFRYICVFAVFLLLTVGGFGLGAIFLNTLFIDFGAIFGLLTAVFLYLIVDSVICEERVHREKLATLKQVPIVLNNEDGITIDDNGFEHTIKVDEMCAEVLRECKNVTVLKVQIKDDQVKYYIVQQ